MSHLKKLPLALTLLRAALAPAVLLLAFIDPSRLALGLCLVIALLSDVFDGVIARRLGIATPALRRLDSAADTLFYITVAIACWRLYPSAIVHRRLPLTALVVLELCRYVFDWIKFRREASYHMWSSKLWGLSLFAGCFALLALGTDGLLLDAAIVVGIVADLEGLAISWVLLRWQADVPSLVHAIRIRSRSLRQPHGRLQT